MDRDYTRQNRDYSHPENPYKGLVYVPGEGVPPANGIPIPTKEQLSTLDGVKTYAATKEENQTELCRSCGWKVIDESSSYDSRVKIFHTRANVGVWALHTLSKDQQLSYTDQVADIIRELRTYTSPVACKVDGTPLDDYILGVCSERAPCCCKKVGFTGKKWIDNLADELRDALTRTHKTNDPAIIEEKFQELRESFPEQGPYVLAHGDLNACNIMVKDDKIEAILDWEWAGYYPWWVERYRSGCGNDAKAELLAPLWERIGGGEMNKNEFWQRMKPMLSVFSSFRSYSFEHPNHSGVWRCPAFCDCRSSGGFIKMKILGQPPVHRLLKEGYDPERTAMLLRSNTEFFTELGLEI
ncbi:hypothetical protein IFR05_012350 [Cadophora sp. M221]|nr:hypothetical protein IFR05_012350 [Cadophora sp. M221]